VSALDCEGRTIWIADAHRDDGKRFVLHADEKLTAFVELESLVRNEDRKADRDSPVTEAIALRLGTGYGA
jgi:hypothetical protein